MNPIDVLSNPPDASPIRNSSFVFPAAAANPPHPLPAIRIAPPQQSPSTVDGLVAVGDETYEAPSSRGEPGDAFKLELGMSLAEFKQLKSFFMVRVYSVFHLHIISCLIVL